MENTTKDIEVGFDATKIDITTEGIFGRDKRYALTHVEYRILIKSETTLQEWSKRFLLISLGLMITIVSRLISFLYDFSTVTDDKKKDLDIGVNKSEWVALGIGIGLSIIVYLLCKTKLNKGEKSELVRQLSKYFGNGSN